MVPTEHFSPAAAAVASVPFPPYLSTLYYTTTLALSQQSIYLLLDRCITAELL